jgi:hypothetical protein
MVISFYCLENTTDTQKIGRQQMTKQVLVISFTGELNTAEMPENQGLAFLQEQVGGLVQVIDLVGELEGVSLWVNEEGKMYGLPINESATHLWEKSYGKTDVIVGNVVITGGADNAGETMPLTDGQVEMITNALLEMVS